MNKLKLIAQKYNFQTGRLIINSWQAQVKCESSELVFITKIKSLLAPAVTKFLPEKWHKITTLKDAKDWWQQMAEESIFLTIQLQANKEIIGFVFLHEESSNKKVDLHLGYLLGESFWAKGFGNELIEGLVHWADLTPGINSLIGGVNPENIASIKILKKNGFCLAAYTTSSKNMRFFKYPCITNDEYSI